jgi:hypothetical protein
MGMMIHDKVREPGREVANQLTSFFAQYADVPMLILLSGEVCFDVIQHLNTKHLPKNLSVSVLDERYDSNQGNIFDQLTDKLFYKQARDMGVHFFDMRPTSGETLKSVAERLNTTLHSWRETNPDGLIVTIQDIGQDGRIAGVVGKTMKTGEFLGTFEDRNTWAVGYKLLPTQSEHLERVTATLSFMRHEVNHAYVIVDIKNGLTALRTLLNEGGYLSDFPALILRDMNKVEIFTDAHM